MDDERFYWIAEGCCTLEHAAEPYESLVSKIHAATDKEERESFPPNTPYKEKGERERE